MAIDGWNFEHTYASLPEIFYRDQAPADSPNPQMVIFNRGLTQALGLNGDTLEASPEIFCGHALPDGARPISQAYAGYQFGHFAMLGDGRAVLLGEHVAPDGRRFDIQLKGSGLTHFSRGGDGLAALVPMLREYIISEAMSTLGIPTTRSLAVVLTGKDVVREKVLKGAVLTRVASSHIRVGTFNYISAFGTVEDTRKLADYSIRRHFPWLEKQQNKYRLFFKEVSRLQAALIAKWQLVGFIHGVMNTDNMAISGETIDYGPCAFMDTYDPDTVFSSIDTVGRYAYKNQPGIGAWNLSRFAEALLPLFDEDRETAIALAQEDIEDYWKCFNENWLAGMRLKLGIVTNEPEDASLVAELLDLMKKHELDYTSTFRSMISAGQDTWPLLEISELAAWRDRWRVRLNLDNQEPGRVVDVIKKHNPAVIPRNHRVEEALAAADDGDYSVMERLLEACRNPYEDSEEYSAPPKQTLAYKTFCGT